MNSPELLEKKELGRGDIIRFTLTEEERAEGKLKFRPVVLEKLQDGQLAVRKAHVRPYLEELKEIDLQELDNLAVKMKVDGEAEEIAFYPLNAIQREYELIMSLQDVVNQKTAQELVRRFPFFRSMSLEDMLVETEKMGISFEVSYYMFKDTPVIDIRIHKLIDTLIYRQEIKRYMGNEGIDYKVEVIDANPNRKRRMGDK